VLTTREPRDDGAVAVLVAILAVVLFGIAALVVDLGMAMETRRDAQKAADLTALASGQDLPDTTVAKQTAITYLADNGWPMAAGNPMTAIDDGNYSNGEVDFSAGNTKITVYPPPRDVGFVFSGVLSLIPGPKAPNGTSVSAKATVEIRSLKNLLPFVLTSNAPLGTNCIKTNQPGIKDSQCPDPTSGNFGYADVGRNDRNTKVLEWNIAKGLDHLPTRYLHEPERSQGLAGTTIQCSGNNSPPTAVVDPNNSPYPDGFNCLPTNTGMKPPQLTDGLVSLTTSCDGRIVKLVSGVCTFVPNNIGTYLTTTQQQNPDSVASNAIPSTILSDPRFGVLPVVATTRLGPGRKDFIILDFVGAYITNVYDKQGQDLTILTTPPTTPSIVAVDAVVFPLRLIQSVGTNNADTGTFLGTGPKIPVLIE